MLSDQEKREMLADARDAQRREAFAHGRRRMLSRRVSLDEYLRFLDFAQKFLPPGRRRPRVTVTRFNKL